MQSFIDMEKMFALLEVEPDIKGTQFTCFTQLKKKLQILTQNIKDDKNAEELDLSTGAISFDNVKFSYDNFKSTILKNLSFEVKVHWLSFCFPSTKARALLVQKATGTDT